MMFLLAIPLVRNVLIGLATVALLAGAYAGWAYRLQQTGAEKERIAASERAQQLRDLVIKKSDQLENSVAKSPAQKELMKDWSRAND